MHIVSFIATADAITSPTNKKNAFLPFKGHNSLTCKFFVQTFFCVFLTYPAIRKLQQYKIPKGGGRGGYSGPQTTTALKKTKTTQSNLKKKCVPIAFHLRAFYLVWIFLQKVLFFCSSSFHSLSMPFKISDLTSFFVTL